MSTTIPFVFFGTPDIAVFALDALAERGFIPALVVTAPDKPAGRGLRLTPSPVRSWAEARGIDVLTPTKLSDESFLQTLRDVGAPVFVLVAYGKLLPKTLLDIPEKGIVNIHPSLLPKHRGPSPGESQILTEARGEDVGVTVMLLDEEMDHGPVLAKKGAIPAVTASWPMRASLLYPLLAREGAALLADALPRYLAGELVPEAQAHEDATYCSKIRKEDAHLELMDAAESNYRKFLAYDRWPRAYFFREQNGKKERVIVTDAALEDGAFVIKKVIPEGKKEMDYEMLR